MTFVKSRAGEVNAFCTYPAGEHGQYCKHRFQILNGSIKGIVSTNAGDAKTVSSWLPGTKLEVEMLRMRECEKALAELKQELSQQKKRVARVMRG